MPVLNHHIVSASDSEASARFYSEVLGLETARKLGHLAVLPVSGDTTLDFIDAEAGFDRQHYANPPTRRTSTEAGAPAEGGGSSSI